eukprot:839807-Amphidinium_carterae.1
MAGEESCSASRKPTTAVASAVASAAAAAVAAASILATANSRGEQGGQLWMYHIKENRQSYLSLPPKKGDPKRLKNP